MQSAYPKVKENIINGVLEWTEIDAEAYNQYYEMLPLARTDGNWFLVGEGQFYLTNGKGIYLVCKQEGDVCDGLRLRFFAKLMTVEAYDSRDRVPVDYSSLILIEDKITYIV